MLFSMAVSTGRQKFFNQPDMGSYQPNLRALSTFWAHMTLTEFNYSSLKEWRKNSADHTKTILLHNEVIQAPAKIAGGKFHWNRIASQHYVTHYKVMYDSRTKACVQVVKGHRRVSHNTTFSKFLLVTLGIVDHRYTECCDFFSDFLGVIFLAD